MKKNPEESIKTLMSHILAYLSFKDLKLEHIHKIVDFQISISVIEFYRKRKGRHN